MFEKLKVKIENNACTVWKLTGSDGSEERKGSEQRLHAPGWRDSLSIRGLRCQPEKRAGLGSALSKSCSIQPWVTALGTRQGVAA